MVAECATARQALTEALTSEGIPTQISQTNFVLAHLGDHTADVVNRLNREHRIHIRHTASLGFPNHARIGVPRPTGVECLVTAIRASLPSASRAGATSHVR